MYNTCWYEIMFFFQFHFLAVFEPVTIDFIHSLPHLDKETCTEVLQMLDSPSREERNIQGNYKYLLVCINY